MARRKAKKRETGILFRIKKRWSFAAFLLIAAIIAGLSLLFIEEVTENEGGLEGFHLQEVSFNDLAGFNADNLFEAEKALRKSCEAVVKRPIAYYAAKEEWKKVCRKLLDSSFTGSTGVRRFIKSNFKPYRVTFDGDSQGLFTGYYVPLLKASRHKTEEFNVPIYAHPKDIVFVDVEEFYPECKKCKIIGRVENNRLKPYHERKDIDGKKDIDAEVLVWLNDPIDSFILHIQGSGKVEFSDGSSVTIGFAGYNGHNFVGIGSLMMKEKLIAGGDYSMPSIRNWLKKNPKKAQELMWRNPRYIFFRILDSDPVGAQGVPLTPRRSLAVDPEYIAYGVPVWLDTFDAENEPLQQLMVAQDTGGAIKGAIRGDFFWGEGNDAFLQAGRMKRRGGYYVLLPVRNHLSKKAKGAD